MTPRDLGLGLIWLGAAAVVAVLVHRIRRGAWTAEAFDQAPPVALAAKAVAAAGLASAIAGIGLLLWSLQ